MGIRRRNSESEKFCFCIGIKQSVIAVSILWLLEGSLMVALMMVAYSSSKHNTVFEDHKALSFTLFLHFAALTVLSIFGLVSLAIYKSTKFMQTYKWFAWILAVFVNAIMGCVTLIFIIPDRIGVCAEEDDVCRQGANSAIVWACIAILFQSLMHLYFTIILRTYVELRVKKERSERRSKARRSSTTKIPKKLLLKVDRTYDDMSQIP